MWRCECGFSSHIFNSILVVVVVMTVDGDESAAKLQECRCLVTSRCLCGQVW